jgi:RHS repeat-associated protein
MLYGYPEARWQSDHTDGDYEYDDLYQLTREHRTGFRTKDQSGNQLTYTSYTYDAANKMASPGTFSYDIKGNMTYDATSGASYTWDALNRLTQWQKTGETTQEYLYNGDWMRVRKTVGQDVTDFLLDEMSVAEEISGSSIISYVGPDITISGTNRTICHTDDVSVRALSNEGQTVSRSGIYDAYGNEYLATGILSQGYGGLWEYYTDETQLQYLSFRYYDPKNGRFLSRDPIGYEGGLNLYGYVDNNPVMYVDPWGLLVEPIPAPGGGAVMVIPHPYLIIGVGIIAIGDLGRWLWTGEPGPITGIGVEYGDAIGNWLYPGPDDDYQNGKGYDRHTKPRHPNAKPHDKPKSNKKHKQEPKKIISPPPPKPQLPYTPKPGKNRPCHP